MKINDIELELDFYGVNNAILYSKEITRECAKNCSKEYIQSSSVNILITCALLTFLHICSSKEGFGKCEVLIIIAVICSLVKLVCDLLSLKRTWSDYNKCIKEYNKLLNTTDIKTKLYDISKSVYSVYGINRVCAGLEYLRLKNKIDE